MKELLKEYPGYYMSYQKKENTPFIYNYRFFDKPEMFGASIQVKNPEVLRRAIEKKILEKPSKLRILKINEEYKGKEKTHYYLFSESKNKDAIPEIEKELQKIINNFSEEIEEPKPLIPTQRKNFDLKRYLPEKLVEEIKKFQNKFHRFYISILLKVSENESKTLVIDSGTPHLRIKHKQEEIPKSMNLYRKNTSLYSIQKLQPKIKTRKLILNENKI